MKYQTIKLPDGTKVKGLFDTPAFFDKMKSAVQFKDKTVVDYGCGAGMYSISAIKEGAKEVDCIDSFAGAIKDAKSLFKKYNFKANFFNCRVGNFYPVRRFDISICAMILHWLGDPMSTLTRLLEMTDDKMVIIYRAKNFNYDVPEHGIWFPTQQELDHVVERNHFRKVKEEVLVEQDNKKEIVLAIYERYRWHHTKMEEITKYDLGFDKEWMRKVDKITSLVKEIPFRSFAFNENSVVGCTTSFVDGIDLFGDRVLYPVHGIEKMASLTKQETKVVRKLLKNIFQAAIKTGLLLADLTPRNIVMKDGKAYFIDLDVILEIKDGGIRNKDYIQLIGQVLSMVGVRGFDGNIKKYEHIL